MNPVVFQDILWIDKKTGKWYHASRELQKAEINNLKSEAQLIVSTSLWKILVNEGKLRAQTRAFIDADSGHNEHDLTELRKAQEFLKAITLFENFIRSISK